MSQTVTAVQAPAAIGRIDGHTNYASLTLPVVSGVTINAGDFVYFSGATGTITNASVSGARLLGMSEQTVTGNATGTNTCLVCIDRNMKYLLKGATAFATVANGTSTSVGQYYDISGATGNQSITTSGAGTTTGQFLCLAVPGMTTFPNTGLAGLTANLYGVFILISSALNPYVAG
jgi:hypothetical protein